MEIVTVKRAYYGYKKIQCQKTDKVFLVKLRIPKGATIISESRQWDESGKHRCDQAEVVSITLLKSENNRADTSRYHCRIETKTERKTKVTHRGFGKAHSGTVYAPGKMVYPDEFYSGYVQCAGGIHFFKNKKAAKQYR